MKIAKLTEEDKTKNGTFIKNDSPLMTLFDKLNEVIEVVNNLSPATEGKEYEERELVDIVANSKGVQFKCPLCHKVMVDKEEGKECEHEYIKWDGVSHKCATCKKPLVKSLTDTNKKEEPKEVEKRNYVMTFSNGNYKGVLYPTNSDEESVKLLPLLTELMKLDHKTIEYISGKLPFDTHSRVLELLGDIGMARKDYEKGNG